MKSHSKTSSFPCYYYGSPCDRFIDGFGFGACYVKGLDGKLSSVCPRFVVKPNVSVFEDLVSKKFIPK